MSSSDSTSLYVAIASLLISVFGLIPLYKDMFDRRKERKKVTFAIDRFRENEHAISGVSALGKFTVSDNVRYFERDTGLLTFFDAEYDLKLIANEAKTVQASKENNNRQLLRFR